MIYQTRPRALLVLTLFLFFVSGACALVYEIVWLRYFTSVFGITVYATSVVLAAFMGGLALGSYLSGRWAERYQWALGVYGCLEVAIGLYALSMPAAVEWITSAHRIFHQQISDDFTFGLLIRFSMALLIMLVPASMMGATLPVLSNFLAARYDFIGREAGRLYAVNTFGAVLGTIGTGFLLIPNFGLSTSNHLAAALSVGIGVIALFLTRSAGARNVAEIRARDVRTRERRIGESREQTHADLRAPTGWILTVIFLSGFAALTYEIVWTRVLSIITFNTVFAFTTMLAAFLTGIATGSYLLAKFIDRVDRLAFWYGALQVAIGLYALVSPLLFGRLAESFYDYQITAVTSPPSSLAFVMQQYALALLIMLVPTILMGGAFPLAFKLYAQASGRRSQGVGAVYASNTFGAILGSVAAGLLMVPLFGLQGTLLIAASVNLIAGTIGLRFASARALPFLRSQAVVVSLSAAAILLFLNVDVVFSDRIAKWGREVIFHQEDITGVVEVWQEGSRRYLVTNRLHTEGSNIPAEIYKMKKQGYLPLLLHADPASFVEIGLGTGIGFAPVLYDRVRSAEMVELSPGVVNAASLFADENQRVLSHPKVRLAIDDGRTHLSLTDKQYDLIVLGLFTPYRAGVGYLYTREFYQEARDKLQQGGMLFQWLASGQLTRANLKLVMNTFRSVFPHVYVWEKGFYLALLGTHERLTVDLQRFKAAFENASIRVDVKEWKLDDPYNFLASYVMGPEGVERFVKGSPVNTEDNLRLEFSRVPVFKAAYTRDYAIANLAALLENRTPPFEILRNFTEEERLALTRYVSARSQALVGLIHEAKGEFRQAQESFRAARETNANDDIAAPPFRRYAPGPY